MCPYLDDRAGKYNRRNTWEMTLKNHVTSVFPADTWININEAFQELKWNAKLQYHRFKFKDVSPYSWKKNDAETSDGLQKEFQPW